MSTSPPHIQGLSTVMQDYDGVILDLWGVVHNGHRPFPTVIPALHGLRAAGKKIWLLSNAPRRAQVVSAQLAAMGIGSDMYDGLLTSGEASFQAVQEGLLAKWGPHCFALNLSPNDFLLQGTGAVQVIDISAADFILATGVPGGSVAANQAVLEQAARRGIPMLCANPDRVVYVGEDLYVCPGALAEAYIDLGGKVTWFGKPYPAVYEAVMRALGTPRILAVGDGMATDVQGAITAGIDVALVTTGIHRGMLYAEGLSEADIRQDQAPADSAWAPLEATAGVKPTYLINALAW